MTDRICSLEDCGKAARSRGYCQSHYWQFKRAGMFAPISLVHRFEQKIEPGDDGCWLWTGSVIASGYGMKWNGERVVPAHRWSYEYHRAPIPDGLHLDHLCRVRRCVNPWHLEPVTNAVNTQRGKAGAVNGARQSAKAFCPYGHPYTDENTYRRPDRRNSRDCRTCMRARSKVAGAIASGLTPTPTW